MINVFPANTELFPCCGITANCRYGWKALCAISVFSNKIKCASTCPVFLVHFLLFLKNKKILRCCLLNFVQKQRKTVGTCLSLCEVLFVWLTGFFSYFRVLSDWNVPITDFQNTSGFQELRICYGNTIYGLQTLIGKVWCTVFHNLRCSMCSHRWHKSALSLIDTANISTLNF